MDEYVLLRAAMKDLVDSWEEEAAKTSSDAKRATFIFCARQVGFVLRVLENERIVTEGIELAEEERR
jgi:ABC-type sulfate transport system substrate-binding protein